MALVIGFAEIAAAVLFLTVALTGASFADVLTGKAAGKYRQAVASAESGASASSASSASSGTGGGTGGAGAEAGGSAGAAGGGGYLNPLAGAIHIGRTDQGVDASLPLGAPIRAPGRVKILGIEPNWFQGQPFVFFKLLDGPDKGKVQYVAEQITNIAPVGSILNQGDTIATYAMSGTGIEYGWATSSGQTLAKATTGYVEGQVTAAGQQIRAWLQSVGAPV